MIFFFIFLYTLLFIEYSFPPTVKVIFFIIFYLYLVYLFSQKQNLIEHVRCVHDNKMDQIPCCYCEDKFVELKDLKAHSISAHQGRKCFYCSVCNSVFSQIKDLHVHVAFAHMTKLQNGIQSETARILFTVAAHDEAVATQAATSGRIIEKARKCEIWTGFCAQHRRA